MGIKGEYLDGALQASLGVFKIVQDKLGIDTGKINPATNAKIYESGKGVTSRGVELDLNGEITKNLSLSFGATHFNAKDANGEKYATDNQSVVTCPYRTQIKAIALRPHNIKKRSN